MRSAQLFTSGIEYSFNTNRMLFNKVDYARLRRNDGSLEEIDKEKLYRIVTGMYCGQMLGSVEKTSFGLIAITPRTANSTMDSQYSKTDGRKVVYSSWNPVNLLRNANWFTFALIAAVLIVLLLWLIIWLIVRIVRLICRVVRRKK